MNLFERYLSLWVALCIAAGVVLGQLAPSVFHAIGDMQVAQVNLPVGILVWLMIIPMLMKIDFKTIGDIKMHKKGIAVTLLMNWVINPISMTLLGWTSLPSGHTLVKPGTSFSSVCAWVYRLDAS